jgi:histidinol dehydrogenase
MATTEEPLLKRIAPADVPAVRRCPVDKKARVVAEAIVEAVRAEGETALRRYAEQFGELQAGASLVLTRDVELKKAYDEISQEEREMLERTAERIRAFALAQKGALTEVTVPIPGGEAGHTVEPVEVAGCYAPGGRYPLPSTVLMTAVTARAAGCRRVIVASPRPSNITLAAAYVSGADVLLPIGGAHAIAALAYGAGPVEACDAVVGPGNMFVTAAKSLVAGSVAIDMLAGPSEVLVIADESADAAVVAADLLAQAEHDPSASCYLISTSAQLAEAVEAEVAKQLAVLPTREIAAQALANGSYSVVVDDLDAAAAISDRNAPEHLELHVTDPMALKAKLKHYGGAMP